MDDVQSLRQQVRKLQRRLDQIEGGPAERERQTVSEIVGQNNEERRGRFSEACQQSRADMIRAQILKATDELANNPGILASEGRENEFREHYGAIPTEDLNAIVTAAKRGR